MQPTALVRSEKRNCPVCFNDTPRDLPEFRQDEWHTVSCRICDMVYLDKAPVYEALSEDLAWTQQFEKEKKRRKEKSPLVAWVDQKSRWRLHIARDDEWAYITEKVKKGRVLDVGCGNRNRVPDVFTPFGIEIEKETAAIAHEVMSQRGGRAIHAPALDGLLEFEDGFFDGMIMRSYLEHEARPRDVLQRAWQKLRPGGVIYVKVPNFGTINRQIRGKDWCGFRFPDHLNYFDISSLRRLAESCGFEFELKNTATRWTNDNMHVFLTRPALS